MNILLISPHSDVRLNESRYVCPALGVVRLAAFLRVNGHYAEDFDPNLYDLTGQGPSMEDKLREREWGMIGVSCLEDTLLNDLSNLHLAHHICPAALLIAGGIEAQFNYQTLLDKTPCSVVIIGEGEIPMLKLAAGEPKGDIPGIVFKNPAKPLSQEQFETATVQVGWEDIDYETYWDHYVKKYGDDADDEILKQIHTVRVFSHNRCPFGCKFCSSTNQLTLGSDTEKVPVVGLNAEVLVDVVERIVKAHPRTRNIYFTDDDFCLHKPAVVRFCKAVIDRGLDHLSYMCFARITDLNDDVMGWLKRAGFHRLNIGVESFSQNVLDEVSKCCSAQKVIDNLHALKKHGVKVFMSLILITPEIKLEDLEFTVNKIVEFACDSFYSVGISLAVRPHKGSEFYEAYHEFETYIREVPGTGHRIKENQMIYAADPICREIQCRFKSRVDGVIEDYTAAKKMRHATFSNIALPQLKLMQDCIDEVRVENNMPEAQWAIRLTDEKLFQQDVLPEQPPSDAAEIETIPSVK